MALALALTASPAMAQSATVAPGAIETLGCYASAGTLTEFGDDLGQSSGICQKNCTQQLPEPALVMATSGGVTCYCGNELPALDQLVDDSKCDVKCMGYGIDNCGGMGFFQLYLTGLGANVHTAPNSSTSASGSSSSTQPAIVTRPGETVFVTPTGSSDEPQKSSSSGPNKIGIAVGVVVGVLALAAIIGVVVFVVKRKRNREIEEEHRRNAANSFLSGKSDKSLPDQRLDPSINVNGRQSIGSIADERDFSRRILQVYLLAFPLPYYKLIVFSGTEPRSRFGSVGYGMIALFSLGDTRFFNLLVSSLSIS